jgi:hypothetical protein
MKRRLLIFVLLAVSLAGASTTWQTTNLPHATAGSAYSASVAAVSGASPYTYTVVSGSLANCVGGGATSLSLNATSGAITGTPSTACFVDFTLHACDSGAVCASPDREFFILIAPVLDAYWAVSGKPVSGVVPTNYFQVAKANGRWQFAGPVSANVFFMFGVDNATYSYQASTCLNGVGSCGLGRYPGGVGNPYFVQRVAGAASPGDPAQLADWGFNTVGEFSLSHFWDGTAAPVPFLLNVEPANIALNGTCTGYSGHPIKDVYGNSSLANLPTSMHSIIQWHEMMDVHDQMWLACSQDTVTTVNPASFASNKYLVGYVAGGESDEFQSLKALLTVCNHPPCPNSNLAYDIAVGRYCPPDTNGSTVGAGNAVGCSTGAAANRPLWAKYCFGPGITGYDCGYGVGKGYLSNKYTNAAGVNAVWGTGYTTLWTSSGTTDGSGWVDGGTTNTGFLDENCTITVGIGGCSDPFGLTALNGTSGQKTAIQNDVNQFYRDYIKRSFAPVVTDIKAADTNHLFFSMDQVCAADDTGALYVIGPNSAMANGFKDAGVQIFIGGYSSQQASLVCLKSLYDNTGLPAMPWFAVSAQADSFWSTHNCTPGIDDQATQALRASSGYVPSLDAVFYAQGSDGIYYVVGFKQWGLTDDNGSGNIAPSGNGCAPNNAVGGGIESTDFGLISNNGNPYDGNSAIIGAGVDHFGYVTGGETGNYGNYLGPVTKENLKILLSLGGGSSGSLSQGTQAAGGTIAGGGVR